MAAHLRVRRLNMLSNHSNRVPRVFKDRSNPLEDLSEDDVFRRYRFHPDTIVYILSLLPSLCRRTKRNFPVPPLLQLLVTLRYLATGSMHLLIGDSVGLSRSTVGRIVRQTTRLLCALADSFIKFPTGPDALLVKNGFADVAGFPNVLGCIDGTFIRIRRPIDNEADFVNRKGYHSLNVQMCCDHQFKITSCYAAWPGSVHDSRVFRSSSLCAQFENGDHNGLLLGDSGYPCRSFLMTPFLNPQGNARCRFNESLCRTRVLIEQTFGILKRRFQILHYEMDVQPNQAVVNTVASAVLHNIGIIRGDIINNESSTDPDNDNDTAPQHNGIQDGSTMREHIVQNYFS